ncbi:hypothetical protein T484DRAFT_1854279 [Baffinella frigidus]|nr:hypothetical protein T484DRAFT_1854279 [Cryptophyta sp. CCMP2293]
MPPPDRTAREVLLKLNTIYIPLPDSAARQALLRLNTSGVETDPHTDFALLADKTTVRDP